MEKLIILQADEFEKKIQTAIASALEKYMPKPIEKEYLTRQEVAETYRVSLPTVHAYMNRGLLAAQKIGGRTLFEKKEVEAALQKKLARR